MTFQIAWRPPAFARMNEYVQANPEWRNRFATTLQELAAELTTDPVSAGESRDPPYRVGFYGPFPLVVTFRPAPEERRVYIVRVRLPDRRRV
jgi:hypothetical protein